MSAADVADGYGRLAAESPAFEPHVAARAGFSILFDAPSHHAGKLKMPVFYAVCDNDTVAPVGPTLKAAARTKYATVKRYPIGHFDIYYGEAFEEAVRDQTEFLVSVLRP